MLVVLVQICIPAPVKCAHLLAQRAKYYLPENQPLDT